MEYRIRKESTDKYSVECFREFFNSSDNINFCWSPIKYFTTIEDGIIYLRKLKSLKDFSKTKTDDIFYYEEI